MKYRLKRNRKFAFQNFQASLQRSAEHLPELESEVVPHYSGWYEASSMQDLANQLEFNSEAEGDDEVLDEAELVVGRIVEDFAKSVLVCPDGTEWRGPELRAMGDGTDLSSEDYADKMVGEIFKKSN